MSDWSANDDSSKGSQAARKASGQPMIKPSHRGLLHKKLGIPQGEKIPKSDLASKPGDSSALSKEKNFARNFGK